MKVTVLTGKYAGVTRNISTTDAPAILISLARDNVKWRCCPDPNTDPQDLFEWTRIDLAARCVSALMHGRSVTFMGEVYRATADTLELAVGYIEDEIVNSGKNIFVEKDDEDGVVIAVHSNEQ